MVAIRKARCHSAWGAPRGRDLRRFLASTLIATAEIILLASAGAAQILEVPEIPQRMANWCWAASAEMVLDYLAPTQLYRAAVGQCTLVQSLPQAQCDCVGPDGFDATDPGCDRPDPFWIGDFLPGLLGHVARTQQPYGHWTPLHRDLLACEITKRQRPVIAWWKDGYCALAGHLVVSSGIAKPTALGDLVLIHDPWPVQMGDSYWLTWRGFGCGFKLGGHCVDYYDIQGTGAPKSCPLPSGDLDAFDCGTTPPADYERVSEIPAAPLAITELLKSASGFLLRKGLGLSESTNQITCNERLLIRGARLVFPDNGTPSLQEIGTTRLLCTFGGGGGPSSIFLIDQTPGGWLLVGFGASHTTLWLAQSAGALLMGLDQHTTPGGFAAAGSVVLHLVDIPGTGDLLLVRDDASAGFPTVRFQAPASAGPRPLLKVLAEPLAGPDSRSLEHRLRALQSEASSGQ
jgi:Papain-like cysteine protease AvrRpt2